MGYKLRMSAEIADWLGDLRESDPLTATEVGAALVAVMDSEQLPGPPLVTDLGTPREIDPGDLPVAMQEAYNDFASSLGLLRQQVARAREYQKSTSRSRLGPQGSEPLPWTEEEIAAAERRAAEFTRRLERWQHVAGGFRARKEAAEAQYTSAEAALAIHKTMLASPTATAEEKAAVRADLTASQQAFDAACAQLGGLITEARDLRRGVIAAAADSTPIQGNEPPPGLLELRADPLGTDISILCAIEPAGTLTLLAVLEGEAAVAEYRPAAIGLSAKLLDEVRTEGWPAETDQVTVADAGSFLERYFDGQQDAVTKRAVALAGQMTLASLRARSGLGLAELAEGAGLSEGELWALQDGDLRSARLRDIAAYVRALGGRLEVTAVIDGEPHILTR